MTPAHGRDDRGVSGASALDDTDVAGISWAHGVDKIFGHLAFMFEYIGEMAKDYVYAITPHLEDALIDMAAAQAREDMPPPRVPSSACPLVLAA
ncbi:hypothetical protein K491DRAFT_219338 [Lophiostoma macrostomum CBS 122681]|uniref:Uncharacterized protein n=1 Tax=Lophiostoma macrostomum CBS 122681 TaxID=1314788 RepID=A0A6A6SQ26_9PLEO|nr:hypothetical protein K491DRAFT_219338 [Lophiostoma macrostomum CBS 122681]